MNRLATLLVLSAALVIVLPAAPSQSAEAQTFQVLHTFTGGLDGQVPFSGLTIDRGGNLYGTASQGGDLTCGPPFGCGTAYRLKPVGSDWTFTPLYSFTGGTDGTWPESRVIFGPDGALYGTTNEGGGPGCGGIGCGTVFKLQPPATFCHSVFCSWTETVLYSFRGDSDGYWPLSADLLFDQSGNIYGTTPYTTSGLNVYGVVYQLTPSGGRYTQSVLHAFSDNDGSQPYNSGVIFDGSGNLYGTTIAGGLYGSGTVFELTHDAGGGWIETVLHNFNGYDGANVYAGLIFDRSGNLYGATNIGGAYGGGVVFELVAANGGWTFTPIYNFPHNDCGPVASLAMDAAGNLYGTAPCGGANGAGSVFKLALVNGVWTYTSLHDFNFTDGDNPWGNVTFDSSGNLYGTTIYGGDYNGLCQHDGCGVVWEITP